MSHTCIITGVGSKKTTDIAYMDGGVIEIEERHSCKKWQHPEYEDIYGVEIVVANLSPNVEKIRIVFE